MTENELSREVVNACLKIHRTLGPGLLESVYESALSFELRRLGIPYSRQQVLPVIYEGELLELGFRTDIIVMNKVIVELKSVEFLAPVHSKILLTYLRLTNIKLGLLVNFHHALMKEGIHRVVNGL